MNSLLGIAYAPEGWHKSRAHTLYRLFLHDPNCKLNFLEEADLWFLIWRYRRQVRDAELVTHSDEVVNGAMSLRF